MEMLLSVLYLLLVGISCTKSSNSIKNERELHLKSDQVSESEGLAMLNSYCIEYNSNELKDYNLFTDASKPYDLDIKVENNKVVLYYVAKSSWNKSSIPLNEQYKDKFCQSSLGTNLQLSGTLNELYVYD